jgi:hypothetical protein
LCLPEAQIPSKMKNTGGPNFFPQWPIFSSGLAEKFCKELATLHPPPVADKMPYDAKLMPAHILLFT